MFTRLDLKLVFNSLIFCGLSLLSSPSQVETYCTIPFFGALSKQNYLTNNCFAIGHSLIRALPQTERKSSGNNSSKRKYLHYQKTTATLFILWYEIKIVKITSSCSHDYWLQCQGSLCSVCSCLFCAPRLIAKPCPKVSLSFLFQIMCALIFSIQVMYVLIFLMYLCFLLEYDMNFFSKYFLMA